MAVHLIMARCGAHAALAGDLSALEKGETAALLDRMDDVPHASTVVRIGGGLAVGRREADRAAWWVVDPSFPLQPPHVLWSQPGLFQPDGEGSVPDAIDVGALWDAATAGGDANEWLQRIVSIVRLLRENDGPLALVVDAPHAALEAAGMLLAVLLGPDLTISVGHPEPDPARCRLSIGPEVYGYPFVPDALPGAGDDDVAIFVRARLRTQPQHLLVPGGLTTEAVLEILGDEGLTDEETSGSMGVVAALLTHAPVDEALIAELVQVTIQHLDPAPWEMLAERPEAERRAASMALMRRAAEVEPTRALLDAFMDAVPRGIPLAPLCATLLDWMRRAELPSIVGGHLETALTEWPQEAGKANRASLWTEAVRILVQTGHHREAAEAVAGPVSARMIEEGSGAAVALMWSTLPEAHRNPLRLAQITSALARHPKGDHAASLLLRSMESGTEDFCRNWIRFRGKAALRSSDEVLQVALASPHLATWLAAVREYRGTRTIREALAATIEQPDDPRWIIVHRSLSEGASPIEALQLAGELPGTQALEPIARQLLLPALAELRFPDAQLAHAAAGFAGLRGSTLWGWTGIGSAPPGGYPDEVIDATLVALCNDPPPPEHRLTCRAVARQLGAAGSWSALDHARWIVRLALSPQESGIAEELLESMLEGLCNRFDAAPHVAAIVGEMMQLDPRHPALVGLLSRWLPYAWRARMPAAFVEAVRVRGVPAAVRPLWNGLVNADR